MHPKDKPPPRPPRFVLFYKKIPPFFLVGKCTYNSQNKFYAWFHIEIFLSSSIIMVQFYHELTIHGVIQSCLNGYIFVLKTPDQV